MHQDRFDAHRFVSLVHRRPRTKWRLFVFQWLEVRAHIRTCYECQERVNETARKNPRPPFGPRPEYN